MVGMMDLEEIEEILGEEECRIGELDVLVAHFVIRFKYFDVDGCRQFYDYMKEESEIVLNTWEEVSERDITRLREVGIWISPD